MPVPSPKREASSSTGLPSENLEQTLSMGEAGADSSEPVPALVAGSRPARDAATHWGPFELREKVGQGGFGEVYRAWDPQLSREVAVKLLRSGGESEEDFQAILKEARLAARVRHPNVVAVFGVSRFEGRVGFWSDFVRGKHIGQILAEQGPMGSSEAALIGIEVCRAVGAVHAAGLLHRDIKSTNVMREEGGRILLLDFGLSQETAQRERAGSGTLLYMAPELLQGHPASVQSDIYSLGVMLFHLTTGRFPLDPAQARNPQATPRRLMDLRPDLPVPFVATVEAAISRDPAKRFATAGAMIAALTESLTQSQQLTPVPQPAPIPGPPPRRPVIGWMVAASIALAAAGVGYWKWMQPAAGSASPSENEEYARGQQLLERYDKSGNVGQALGVYQKLTQKDPKFALGWAGLSDAYAARFDATKGTGLLDQARAAGSRAVELDPQQARTHLALGRAYVRSAKGDLAAHELQQAVKLDARNAAAYGELGLLYEQQGRAAEVEPALQMARDLAPGDWRWANRLGLYYRRVDKLDAAIREFQQVASLSPDNPFGYANLGACFRAKGQLDRAEQCYRKALEANPDFPNALMGLGNLLTWQGQFTEAAQATRRMTKLQPESYMAWASLGVALYWAGGEMEEARAAYRKAIELGENLAREQAPSADLLSSLATYYAAVGDRERAIQRIRQARALSSGESAILARAAMTYELIGNRAEAREALQKAVESGYRMEFIERNPELKELRQDPNFVAWLKKSR